MDTGNAQKNICFFNNTPKSVKRAIKAMTVHMDKEMTGLLTFHNLHCFKFSTINLFFFRLRKALKDKCFHSFRFGVFMGFAGFASIECFCLGFLVFVSF